MNKLEMRVGAIGIDEKSGDPIVVLKDFDNKLSLPIWIGLPEARAITMAANKIVSTRPLTHDLLFSTIKQLGYNVKEICIDNIEAHVFTATISLTPQAHESNKPALDVDARPSDAIALALTAGAPLLVSDRVVKKACVSLRDESAEKAESETEEFSKFIQEVKASDFKSMGTIELPPDEED